MRTLLLLFLLTLAGAAYEAAASKAGLATVTGTVKKQQKGAWSQAQAGDLLAPGDRLRTGKDSLAMLLLDNCTSLRLGAQSELVIISLANTQLTTGRVWVNVQKGTTFELKGPNAVASVKGTSFEMTDLGCKVWHGLVDCGGTEVATGSQYARGKISPFNVANQDSFQRWNVQCDELLQTVAVDGLDATVAARAEGTKVAALPAARPKPAVVAPQPGAPPAAITPPPVQRVDLTPAWLKKLGQTLPRYTP